MSNIYIFRDGSKHLAHVEKMFGTHGPYMLEGKRVDQLQRVQLMHDSSTQTHVQTGTNSSTANGGSVVGRAIVGELIAGPAGAIIGGSTASRTTTVNTVTQTTINTELTVELLYLDGTIQYVLIDDLKPFHWLLSFVAQQPMSDDDVQTEQRLAQSIVHQRGLNNQLRSMFTIPSIADQMIKKYKWYWHAGMIAFSIYTFFQGGIFLLIPYFLLYKLIARKILFSGQQEDAQRALTKVIADLARQADAFGVQDVPPQSIEFDPNTNYEMTSNGKIVVKAGEK